MNNYAHSCREFKLSILYVAAEVHPLCMQIFKCNLWFLDVIYSDITGLVWYSLRSNAYELMQAFSEGCSFIFTISHDWHLLSSLGVKDKLIDKTQKKKIKNLLSCKQWYKFDRAWCYKKKRNQWCSACEVKLLLPPQIHFTLTACPEIVDHCEGMP